jgi:hypothetical protein
VLRVVERVRPRAVAVLVRVDLEVDDQVLARVVRERRVERYPDDVDAGRAAEVRQREDLRIACASPNTTVGVVVMFWANAVVALVSGSVLWPITIFISTP